MMYIRCLEALLFMVWTPRFHVAAVTNKYYSRNEYIVLVGPELCIHTCTERVACRSVVYKPRYLFCHLSPWKGPTRLSGRRRRQIRIPVVKPSFRAVVPDECWPKDKIVEKSCHKKDILFYSREKELLCKPRLVFNKDVSKLLMLYSKDTYLPDKLPGITLYMDAWMQMAQRHTYIQGLAVTIDNAFIFMMSEGRNSDMGRNKKGNITSPLVLMCRVRNTPREKASRFYVTCATKPASAFIYHAKVYSDADVYFGSSKVWLCTELGATCSFMSE